MESIQISGSCFSALSDMPFTQADKHDIHHISTFLQDRRPLMFQRGVGGGTGGGGAGQGGGDANKLSGSKNSNGRWRGFFFWGGGSQLEGKDLLLTGICCLFHHRMLIPGLALSKSTHYWTRMGILLAGQKVGSLGHRDPTTVLSVLEMFLDEM